METKKPFHEVVAEKLIEQLKRGTAPWLKPWAPGAPGAMLPINAATGKRYRGINALHLMAQPRADRRWMTYKQALSLGAQVLKGEKGNAIQYWKFSDERTKLDGDGKVVHDAIGQPVKESVTLERPRVFYAVVFNAEQIEGLPPLAAPREPTWDPSARAESILAASKADIRHEPGNRAFYRPKSDTIHLPERGQFSSSAAYYATALHELGHWTGHSSRLDRDLANPFGSEAYAKEELRAEIASMILGDELALGHDPAQHVAYVGSWIKVLEDDPLELFRAAASAERIFEHVMTYDQHLELRSEHAMDVEQSGDAERTSAAQPVAEMQGDAAKEAREARLSADVAALLQDPELQRRAAEIAAATEGVAKPVYLDVPYAEKKDAKALGARWDREHRLWFVPPGKDAAAFARWQQTAVGPSKGREPHGLAPTPTPAQAAARRTYLAVPYVEKDAARTAGALWDRATKAWYVGPDADLDALEKWRHGTQAAQEPAMDPREEFANALRSVGCRVEEPHPVMDGRHHRIHVDGDKRGERAGFYVGHLDGRPAGYVKNNRTGHEAKWKAKGYVLDPAERWHLRQTSANRLSERTAEQLAQQEKVAERLRQEFAALKPATAEAPYLQLKRVQAHAGMRVSEDGQTLHVPAFDVHGQQWTTQYIQADGTKRFAKGGRKEGCFHPVGGMSALKDRATIIVAEGYATAATLTEATGIASVAAFDCGNMLHAANAIREAFPNAQILVAGDDDSHGRVEQDVNPGRAAAENAAAAVGGRAIFPVFLPGERSAENRLSDFNDLATRSELGVEGVRRQVASAVLPHVAQANFEQNMPGIVARSRAVSVKQAR